MSKKRVYLDHNATTPLHPEVKKAMTGMMGMFGNPSSMHGFGRDARKMIEDSRTSIAEFINAAPEEIIFVGSGSEANNTVFNLTACCASLECSTSCKHRKGIITTSIEHPCIIESSKCLAERGMKIDYLKVDKYGKVNIDQLK
ncbi:MAG: aminotransferase class V-fold PLP-dependent enzyme, partial [Candidatus Omnitrophica bacterium]|nr:aminotransferase class V-fold PLP-dependent enzyme [Candidatus Omnitrophota bacterium]